MLGALARSIDSDIDLEALFPPKTTEEAISNAVIKLRDPELQEAVAVLAWLRNHEQETSRGITRDDYVRWSKLFITTLADAIDAAIEARG